MLWFERQGRRMENSPLCARMAGEGEWALAGYVHLGSTPPISSSSSWLWQRKGSECWVCRLSIGEVNCVQVKCGGGFSAGFVQRSHWQGGRWQRHASELVARGGMHGSKRSETGVVGEEVACAVWSRSAKGGRQSPNECAAVKLGRWTELQSSRCNTWRQTQSPLMLAIEFSRLCMQCLSLQFSKLGC